MAKIFTITEGVENMGALKSGGQGSVYKGKRIGEIITAIKILPTPIYSETGDDKNFSAFQNEVQKLKKVNEDANPNVVTIINSGITDTGNFPFIEMEYIEGPDLEELLKPPHEPVFTIKEVLKVADQLSNALAHCHRVDVKHGDIKSNNVKFNTQTGNYILLDFGLSVMSDEQRRTSLRQAGAIEFMAPEQHEGQLLFETEVYSFGVIMFELLSGTVPFHLKDNSESARNNVLVSHMDTELPSPLSLRQQHCPEWWSNEKKEHEMQVPEWMVSMIYKCLEKKPADRFANGMQLHEHIVKNSILAAGNLEWGADRIAKLEQENEKLLKEKLALQQQVNSYEALSSNEGTHRATPTFFSLKNLLLILIPLLAVGLVAYYLLDKKNSIQEGSKAVPVTPAENVAPNAIQSVELKSARAFLVNGRLAEAKILYRSLATQEIPEAMYEYGNLVLFNNTDQSNCAEAMEYLRRAAGTGYAPAKRTVGFLYAYALDTVVLKQKGYQGCSFSYDIKRGAKLLMEATLQGDSSAGRLLDQLNVKIRY